MKTAVDPLDDTEPETERATRVTAQSGWVPRAEGWDVPDSELPTQPVESGVVDVVIDEIRRLYVEGATEDALLLAATIAPASSRGWSTASVPVLAISPGDLLRVPLDHRAGFVLAHIDGQASLATLIDLVPLPEAEVIGLVELLVALDVIRLDPPAR